MRFDILKIISKQADNYCVASGEPKIYTDGCMICVAGDMAEKKWFHSGANGTFRVEDAARKMWDDIVSKDGRVSASDQGIVGNFTTIGYMRRLQVNGSSVYISERFRRCFDANAEFRAINPRTSVTVYEEGILKGIIMPIKMDGYNLPEVPYLADDVLFHECPEMES